MEVAPNYAPEGQQQSQVEIVNNEICWRRVIIMSFVVLCISFSRKIFVHSWPWYNPTNPIRVHVTVKEQDYMTQMKKAMFEMEDLLNVLNLQQDAVTTNTHRIRTEIDNTFNIYVATLKERVIALQTELSADSKIQSESIKGRVDSLKQFMNSVKKGLDKQNTLLLDPKMNGKEREIKMGEITTNVLSKMDQKLTKIKSSVVDITFKTDRSAVIKFLSSIGSIKPDAPVLTVSDIGRSSATLRLQSKYDNEDVLYSLRYRGDGSNVLNDDNINGERKWEWKEYYFPRNSDTITINEFQSEVYKVYGRYKVIATSLWSEMSKITTFRTLKRFDSLWDLNRCHKDLILSSDNSVTKNGDNGFSSVYSKHTISTETMSSLKFAITLRRKAKGSNGNILVGIMDARYIENANTGDYYYIGRQQHQIAVHIRDSWYPYRQINGKSSNIQSNAVKWNIGDRLRLDFDLKGRRCTVFLNDQLLGTLTDKLPESFFLAVSASSSGTSLETTVFEIV